jgi:L,D-transpeptidase ErfK/SrfK
MRHEHIQQQVLKLAATAWVAIMVGAVEASAQKRIVVSLTDHKLVLLDGSRVVKTYDTASGKPSTPTPAGSFTVAGKVANPVYRAHGQDVPAGPNNPVGTRWIGLSMKGYGIHGTNAPKSIGKNASHGCIRMRNKDVEELFELVQAGMPVELRSGALTELVSAD